MTTIQGGDQANRRPTIRDVAELAEVGLATVSRVINESGPVRESTAERVRSAIHTLGFRRDEVARTLRPGQNSRTLGLKVGDLTNPFWAHLVKGSIGAARERGYAVLVGSADEDPLAEQQQVDDLLSRRVGGLIIAPDSRERGFLLDPSGGVRVPVVFVDRPARDVTADTVVFDNELGGYLAAKHLIDHGHRRIGIIVAPSYYTTGRRLRGYRRALRESGIVCDESLVKRLQVGSVEDSAAATALLLAMESPPTAIFSTTNFLTEGVLAALGGKHDSVALVGFDDFHLAPLLPTPVTVVAADVSHLGVVATQLLMRRVEGYTGDVERLVLPVSLIPRGSGELPPNRRLRQRSTTPSLRRNQ